MATTTFNDLITFSRGTNATLTGPNGLIQWAPSNLLTNSQDFEAAAWVAAVGTATITANAAAAPDGTTTADTFTATSVNATRWQTWVPIVGANYVFSIWLKRRTGSGVVEVTADATNFTTVAVTAEWQRFSVAATNVTVGTKGSGIRLATNGDAVDVWGAQLELGSTATAYNNTSVRNLLGFSEAFDNAFWTKSGASIVTGAQANPVNGLFNAQKLMEDTAVTAAHGFSSANVTTVVGTPMTASFYAKAAGRSWIVANAFNSVNRRCWFDLANGTAGTTAAGCTTSITSVGGGWYRCAIIQTAAAATMSLGLFASTADGVLSYTGDGNSGVFVYGAQLSNSASLDPYVPTPAAAPSSTAYYGPRLDYDPVTLQPRGFLVEEARTNSLLYSEDFSQSAWTDAAPGSTVTVAANDTTAPDGSLTADRLTAATGGTNGMARQIRTLVASTTYTGSLFVKASTSTQSRILLRDTSAGTNFADATLTWSSGVPSVAGGATGTWTVTAFGNGWYRVAGTGATGATASPGVTFSVFPDTAAGTNAIFAWGAQLEAGAFATSYIPTIASTVTRSADIATISGSLFSQWYRQDEGAFVVEGSRLFGGNSYAALAVARASGGITDRVDMGLGTGQGGSAGIFRDDVIVGGVNQAALGDFAAFAANTPYKGALAYAVNNFASATSGANLATDTSGTVPTVALLDIGNRNSGNQLNGHIRSIRYYPVRAADFQLQALTT
jgi:hypothetical protein